MDIRKFDTEHWRRIDAILDQVMDSPESERPDLVRSLCGPDAALTADVLAFLTETARADGFLEEPAGERAAHLIEVSSQMWNPAARLGQMLGSYRLVSLLGEGGMGVVYVGERDDGQYKKKVAVKLMLAMGSESPLRARFLAERQMLAKLDHPNTARLLDGGLTDEGIPYIVMELVAGTSVLEYCEREELDIQARIRLFQEICAGVDDAHRQLVLHCDLKPANILVTADGVPKLLDFGIGRWLDPDAEGPRAQKTPQRKLMTPDYASPEQLRGEPLTTASDIFALGVLLYELLTGIRPRQRAESDDRTDGPADVAAEAPPPSQAGASAGNRGRIRRDLDAVVMKALATDPRARYGSARELADDLRNYLEHLPVRAVVSTPAYRFRKLVQRNRAASAGVVLVMVTVIAGIAGTAWQARVAGQERDAARLEAERAGAVSRFMIDLFETADPNENKGADVTAREVLDRSLDRIQNLDDQPELQVSLEKVMATVYYRLGRTEQARGLYEKALATEIELYGPASAPATDTMIDLGITLLEQGRHDDAETLLRRSLEIRRGQNSREPQWLTKPIRALARLLNEKGNSAAAIVLFEDSFDNMDADDLADVEGLGRAYNNYAAALSNVGHYARADTAFGLAESYYRQTVSEEHYYFGALYNNWALTVQNLGDKARGEELHRKALAIRRKLKHNQGQIGISLINLGNLLVNDGRAAEGLPMLTEALDINREAFGDSHFFVAATIINVGTAQLGMGDFAAAEASYREGERIFMEIFGEEHAAVAIARTRRGQAAHQSGNLAEAEALLREAVAIHRPLLPSKILSFAETLEELGVVLMKQDKPAAAEAHLGEAHTIFVDALGADSAQAVACLNLLQQTSP
jgi:serine/threonine-protein kinase